MIQIRNKQGLWRDHECFIKESSVDRMTIASLAGAGALAEFGLTRRDAIWSSLKTPCFGTLDEYEDGFKFPKETPGEMVDGDFKAMDTSLYMHPAEVQKVYYWNYDLPSSGLTTSRQIPFRREGEKLVVFGIVIVRQAPPTAKKVLFLTLEDEFGFINCIVRPAIYEKQPIDRELFLCLEGKLQKVGASHSFIVEKMVAKKERYGDLISLQQQEEARDASPLFAIRNFI
jgi:DNA polymerase III alpha subunit